MRLIESNTVFQGDLTSANAILVAVRAFLYVIKMRESASFLPVS